MQENKECCCTKFGSKPLLLVFWVLVAACIYKSILLINEASSILIGVFAGMCALFYAAIKIREIMSFAPGNDKMQKIAGFIHVGAMSFLKREYSYLAVFVLIVGVCLGFFLHSWPTALCFFCGALCSAIAGVVGMAVSTKANVRCANAARDSLNSAFSLAFSGGLVMGLTVVGLGLVGLTILMIIFQDPSIVNGFALGGSSIALFARVGGGIYTKAADVGADLVGKVEEGIPEDDHRNPAVVADNVGDNVGDVAGMGADLFESYIGAIVAAVTLGATFLALKGAFLPIVLAGIGVFASLIGSIFVKTSKNTGPMKALNIGTVASTLLFILGSAAYIMYCLPGMPMLILTIIIGVITGLSIGVITQFYTSAQFKPVIDIAKASLTGPATNIISGFNVGLASTFLPVLIICMAIVASFFCVANNHGGGAGLFSIAIAAVSMLATVGMTVAVDAYGPICDNAGGIAQMSDLESEVRERTDKLDCVGNTTAAIAKGFAIGSAALTSIALLSAFTQVANVESIELLEPTVVAGVIFGASLPFVFCSLAIGAVGRAAGEMVEEVRRQFRELVGIMEDKCEPDYQKCIHISTNAAIKSMVLPGVLAILAPLAVGFILGTQALGGMLIGSIGSGICLAIMLANSGGAWDNAKKYIEEGNMGGKNSPAHQAAVVGDTVGDPFKDTAGPSLNILLKLMAIVSLVFAPLFVQYGSLLFK